MSKKTIKAFKALQRRHEEAVAARKQAARARKAIRGFGGTMGEITALASDIGTAAVKAELEALKAERRALKSLHAFAASLLKGLDPEAEEDGKSSRSGKAAA